jgi:hypothetical protein
MVVQKVKIMGNKKSVLVFNYLLLIINIILILGAVAIIFSRNTFIDISEEIYKQGSPIMGSVVLDLVLRKEVAFILIGYMIILLFKECIIKVFRSKLYINLCSLIFLLGFVFFLIFKTTYGPISSFS